MKPFFGTLAAVSVLASGAYAQDNLAIEDVIGNQLEAFNQRNVSDAWQYAAPNIQQMFGSQQNFGMMVQQGYPMVWTNSDVRFADLTEGDARSIQRVLVQDAGGVTHALDYFMVQTADGWRIAGVTLVPRPDVGA